MTHWRLDVHFFRTRTSPKPADIFYRIFLAVNDYYVDE